MIVTIERDALHSALNSVAGRARVTTQIEILKHVLLTTTPETLKVAAHNLESYSEAEATAHVSISGSRAVPADTFARLIGSLPLGSQLQLRLDDRSQMEVVCGRSTYRLPTLPAEDFPLPLIPENPTRVTVGKADVHRLFEMPRAIVEPKNPYFYYKGVSLHVASNGKLAAIAADGYRVLRVCTDITVSEDAPPIIIPKTAMDEIRKLAEGGGELAWSNRIFSVSNGTRRFATTLIDGTFPPDYERKLPPVDGGFIEVDLAYLLEVLRRLDVLSEDHSEVTLSWESKPQEMRIELSGRGSGVETLSCDGQEIGAGSVSGVPHQFVSLLAALEADSVRLVVRDASSPFRIIVPNDPDLIAVLVPCAPRHTRASAAA